MPNNSSTALTSVIEHQRDAFQKYQFTPLLMIAAVGFIANVMVILSGTKKSCRRKYSTNSFILNLAVADLGIVCFYITTHFVEYTRGLHAKNWTCQYVIPIRETFSIMSIMTVAVLGVVRLLQIHRGEVLSMKLTNAVISGMWLLSYCIVSFPLSFIFYHTPEDTCDAEWPNQKLKKIHVAFLNLIILIPLIVTTCSYICIIKKMRNFNRGLATKRVDVQMKSQAISLLLCMLIIANWLGLAPLLIYSTLKVFIDIYNKYPYKAWSIMSILFLSTSATNPLLILIANKEYRNEIRRAFYKRERIVPLVLQRVRVEAKLGNFYENPVVIQIDKMD